MPHLSITDARRIALSRQGLLQRRPFGKGDEGVLALLDRLGYVQIDTISVVKRAHHHVLMTRIPDYMPEQLHELQTVRRRVFEYWAHAAAYLPISDYRYCLPRMHAFRSGKIRWFPGRIEPRTLSYVRDRITAEGPLMARDFASPAGRKSGSWWDWKPAKVALDLLFMQGHLLVGERRGFQKVYDLAERLLPPHIDTSTPSAEALAAFLIHRAINAHGLVTEAEIGYQRSESKPYIREQLAALQEEGEITAVTVGRRPETYYSRPALLADTPPRRAAQVHILSPFDNAVIQRQRLFNLFDFNYQIECYVPGPKRKYGYFVLPFLHGTQFAGRMDAKADRPKKTLIIKGLWLEERRKPRASFYEKLRLAIQRFAAQNGCETIHAAPAHRRLLGMD